MANGFRVIRGATGSKQIDQNFYNLALISKQVITSGATAVPGYSSTVSYVEVVITSVEFPVVAVACTAGVTPIGLARSGSQWTFKYYAFGLSQQVSFFVFGRPPVLGPGYGFRIKKGGQIMFDSRQRYLRRVAKQGLGNGDLGAGRTYAAVLSNTGYFVARQDVSDPFVRRYLDIHRRGSIQINGSQYVYGDSTLHFAPRSLNQFETMPPMYQYSAAAQPVVFIDVTNY